MYHMLLVCRTHHKLEPALSWFNNHAVPAVGLSISEVNPLSCTFPEEAGGIILTSSSALLSISDLFIPKNIPVYTVGSATAEQAQELGFNVVYSGKSNAHSMAEEISSLGNLPQKLWHPRASNSDVAWHRFIELTGRSVLSSICYETHYIKSLPNNYKAGLEHNSYSAVALYSPKAAETWQALIHKNAPVGLTIPAFAFSSAVADKLDLVHTVYTCESPTNEAMQHLWNEQENRQNKIRASA
jgi:uroporphyrinogen-III synthase